MGIQTGHGPVLRRRAGWREHRTYTGSLVGTPSNLLLTTETRRTRRYTEKGKNKRRKWVDGDRPKLLVHSCSRQLILFPISVPCFSSCPLRVLRVLRGENYRLRALVCLTIKKKREDAHADP